MELFMDKRKSQTVDRQESNQNDYVQIYHLQVLLLKRHHYMDQLHTLSYLPLSKNTHKKDADL